jgi:hypothetical protein
MSLPLTANARAISQVSQTAMPQVNSPAQAARAYLASNADSSSSEDPFGKLVMQFARGETPNT